MDYMYALKGTLCYNNITRMCQLLCFYLVFLCSTSPPPAMTPTLKFDIKFLAALE